MKRFLAAILLMCIVAYSVPLLNPSAGTYTATISQQPQQTIWVSSNGWHTGIIVPIAAIPSHLLPEKTPFQDYQFLEMGWGDAGFYQAEEITAQLAWNALFLRSSSIVHLVGFNRPPSEYFSNSQVVELRVSQQGFSKMLEFMHNSISRSPSRAVYRTTGLYGFSFFYPGVGSYSAANTCNHWAANALKAAGVPIMTWYAVSSGMLMRQVDSLKSHASPKNPAHAL